MDDPAPKTLTEPQAWVGAICEVTGWNVVLNAGRAAKLGKSLRQAGGTLACLLAHYGQQDYGMAWWWYRDDWRGKRGQRPSQAGIQETWGAWKLPIAIAAPQSAVGGMLAYLERLEHGDAS